jgi:spore maturation protein SpmB
MNKRKPVANISGQDGNVFNLMGICSTALKSVGKHEQATEMLNRIMSGAGSYDEALQIMAEYCDLQ